MTSNSRQTRTAGSTDAANAKPPNAKPPKTFLDAWIEPPLRAPAPSFMDHPHLDITRHGVLENMAPLGTMPNSKVKKLGKTEGPRRVTLVTRKEASASATSTPREAVTPEPPARRRSESHKIEDAGWNPTTPVAQISARKYGVRDSVSRQSLPPQMSPSSVSASPTKQELDLQRTDRAVDYACEEARAAGRLHTGYALRTFYDDHRSNPQIVRLFDLIASQEATGENQAEFRGLMKKKKKEGRAGGIAKLWAERSENALPTTPVLFSTMDFGSPRKKFAAEAASEPPSRSPHKDSPGHIHKKHKGNSYERGAPERPEEANGMENSMNNGTHRRARSNSGLSTDSDLSSVDVELLDHANSFAPSPSRPQINSDTWPATTESALNHPPQPQPPIAPQQTLGPKLHAWDTTTKSVVPSVSSSSFTTTTTTTPTITKSPTRAHHRRYNSASMPGCVSNPFVNHPPPSLAQQKEPPLLSSSLVGHHPTLKSLKKAAAGQVQDSEESDRTLRLKRKARDITENHGWIRDSFDRHRVKTQDPDSEAEGGVAGNQPAKSGQILRFRSSQASKRMNDESDDLSSPTLLSFQTDAAPNSSSNSRAGTPGVLNRPARKLKGGLRMKTSPMKKKAGPSAGIPRASGERNSPVGNGVSSQNQDDNDDYCSSCGGNGELVCCDGCTRSFHLRCVDPPLSENQLPDNWFCNACNALRNPAAGDESTVFGQLLAILKRKNPSAFNLPKDIREYFEGVRTGAEGEYEEGVVQKPKRNTGYEEAPDYLKLKDTKGNFILCHECHKGAGNGNPIIPCSYCSLHWHLDCLDPPLANPPPASRLWRCPCHVDDLLAKVPESLGPAHRFRRIKGASVIKPAFPRGFKNDGHIEIEFAPSEDEDEGFFDHREFGKVYRLPEQGIKLDFISRIRNQVRPLSNSASQQLAQPDAKSTFTPADRRSLLEQQAALNFAQLASHEDLPDGAQILIDALLAQASPAVVAMMAQGDATNIANDDLGQRERQSLLAMKALIEGRLQNMELVADAPVVEPVQAVVENGVIKEEEDAVISI